MLQSGPISWNIEGAWYRIAIKLRWSRGKGRTLIESASCAVNWGWQTMASLGEWWHFELHAAFRLNSQHQCCHFQIQMPFVCSNAFMWSIPNSQGKCNLYISSVQPLLEFILNIFFSSTISVHICATHSTFHFLLLIIKKLMLVYTLWMHVYKQMKIVMLL